MKAFITGIAGFVGSHLAEHLAALGAEVGGLDCVAPSEPSAARIFVGDLREEVTLRACLAEFRPTHIFHLAGCLGGARVDRTWDSNVLGTVRLLEAARGLAGEPPWVLIASSSAVYGCALRLPVDEGQQFRPLTHYGASKAAQELVGLEYWLAGELPVVRTRTFNLVGPRQSRALLLADLAYQAASAERARDGCLRVGNLEPRRDYTDVRDAVRAYALLASWGVPGEVYNVCSGRSRSVRECVDALIAASRAPLRVEVEESRKRAQEIGEQVGSKERLRRATGWEPGIAFETSVADLLDYWRGRLGRDA